MRAARRARPDGEPEVKPGTNMFLLPHRLARGVTYSIVLLLITLLTWSGGPNPSWLAWHLAWLGVILVIEYRTARLRIVVGDTKVVCHGVLWNRSVHRSDLKYIDLDVPTHGAFLPGGGESVVAVLHNGRRVTLSYDRTRRPGRHCRHYADLSRILNARLDTSETRRNADESPISAG
jgi:hypothetical protein